jgi:hypothetical protein
LETFVNNNNIPVASAPHGDFWKNGGTESDQYTYFTTQDAIPGFPILNKINGKYDGETSNIILALRGKAPFIGPPNNPPQMPPSGPYLDGPTIDAISAWITAGAKQ